MLSRNDKDSIDFDFFDDESLNNDNELVKMNGKKEQSDSSKIVTMAIIEAKPKLPGSSNLNLTSSLFSNDSIKKTEKLQHSPSRKNFDNLSSPTSSLERKMLDFSDAFLDDSSINCVAYNEELCNHESSLILAEEKESRSSSSCDSTTTFSSDLTSVSPLSSLSIISFKSDDNENLSQTNFLENGNHEYKEDVSCEDEEFSIKSKLSEEAHTNDNRSNNEDDQNCDDYKSPDLMESQYDDNIVFDEKDDPERLSLENSVATNYSDDEYESDILSLQEFEAYENELGQENEETTENSQSQTSSMNFSRKNSSSMVTDLEEELGDISLGAETNSFKTSWFKAQRRSNKLTKRKKFNLTFSREEIIRIERDNMTLLKKIMSYSKPKTVLQNQTSSHKKTSTAINRAKQQKKIEQDNYILYNKISSMSRTKKVF